MAADYIYMFSLGQSCSIAFLIAILQDCPKTNIYNREWLLTIYIYVGKTLARRVANQQTREQITANVREFC